jgi:hypothetical protein
VKSTKLFSFQTNIKSHLMLNIFSISARTKLSIRRSEAEKCADNYRKLIIRIFWVFLNNSKEKKNAGKTVHDKIISFLMNAWKKPQQISISYLLVKQKQKKLTP